MAKNAINIINAQREVIQAELHRLNKKYTNLKTEHQKLVEETVELENKNVKLTDAIDTMCKGCVLKYTDQCVQCNLHEVAVELIWQLES